MQCGEVLKKKKKEKVLLVRQNEHSASECFCVCLWSSDESPSPAGSLRLAGGPKTSAESSNFSPAHSFSLRLHYGMRNDANTQKQSRCSTGTSPGTAAPPLGLSLTLPLSVRPFSCLHRLYLKKLGCFQFSAPLLLSLCALLLYAKWQGYSTSGGKYVSFFRSKISL